MLSIDLKQALAEDDNEIVEAEVRDITQPEPEQEKKQPAARKPKEEKVAEPASEVPFVQEETSSGVSNDPPEPERHPEYDNPDTEPEIKAPAKLSPPEMLVQAGFFREVGLAKAALMWYKGSIEYEPLVAWAAKVQEGMKQGLPLAQASKNASQ